MNIICGAQACGFGPTSKLVTILDNFSRVRRNVNTKIIYFGDGVSLTFIKKHSSLVDLIIDSSCVNEEKHYDVRQCGIGIIVMNHKLAFMCYEWNIPYVFIDSLFGFWNITNKNRLYSVFATNRKEKISRALFESFSVHEQKLISHHLSLKSYAINNIGIKRRITMLNKYGLKRPELTKPLEFSSLYHSSNKRTDKGSVLINIGGVDNFIVNSTHDAVYPKIIFKLAKAILSIYPNIRKVTICGGAYLKEHRYVADSKEIVTVHLDKKEFIKEMIRAEHYLMSPGLTSITEAIKHRKIFVLIPEQHASQYYNMLNVMNTKLCRFCVPITSIMGKQEFSKNDFQCSKEIIALLNTLNSNELLFQKLIYNVLIRMSLITHTSINERMQIVEEIYKSLNKGVTLKTIIIRIDKYTKEKLESHNEVRLPIFQQRK